VSVVVAWPVTLMPPDETLNTSEPDE